MPELFVRTETKDYDHWYSVFSAAGSPTREEYGIRTRGVYRDAENPNNALIHFEVDDLDRMREYLSLPEVASASDDAGVKSRTIWMGEPQG